MKSILTALLLSFLTISTATAGEVKIIKTWLEHNATNGSESGMRVHAHVELSGYKNVTLRMVAYFESPKGVGIKDTNNRYCTVSGDVSVGTDFTPGYDNCEYNDLSVFIPNDELHLKEGKHTYYCNICIFNNNKFLARGESVEFTGTMSSQQTPSTPQNNQGKRTGKFYYVSDRNQQTSFNFYYNNGVYFAESSNLGMAYGYFLKYVLQEETSSSYIFYQAKVYYDNSYEPMSYMPKMIVSKNWDRIVCQKANLIDGSDIVYTKEITKAEYDNISKAKSNFINYMEGGGAVSGGSSSSDSNSNSNSSSGSICPSCKGSGNCAMCKGNGVYKNRYDGNVYDCPSCHGGRCGVCYGNGIIR